MSALVHLHCDEPGCDRQVEAGHQSVNRTELRVAAAKRFGWKKASQKFSRVTIYSSGTERVSEFSITKDFCSKHAYRAAEVRKAPRQTLAPIDYRKQADQ